MKDIHEVLRQKQAKFAQLGKQIELLQQAAEKLREVAPLLAELDEESDEPVAMSAKAGVAAAPASAKPAVRAVTPRWP
jgi:hypothetical protein